MCYKPAKPERKISVEVKFKYDDTSGIIVFTCEQFCDIRDLIRDKLTAVQLISIYEVNAKEC